MWKEYYIQLWEKDDWEQEGQLTLFELYQKNLKLKQMKKNYFIHISKLKDWNHIKDKIRQQESDRRKSVDFHILKLEKLVTEFHQNNIFKWASCSERCIKRFKEKISK